MMTLRDLINKLLGRETSSANTARERLQLVLAHDRVDMSSLTTDLLDKMRKEILDVVAKYVEIDFEESPCYLENDVFFSIMHISAKRFGNHDKEICHFSVNTSFLNAKNDPSI